MTKFLLTQHSVNSHEQGLHVITSLLTFFVSIVGIVGSKSKGGFGGTDYHALPIMRGVRLNFCNSIGGMAMSLPACKSENQKSHHADPNLITHDTVKQISSMVVKKTRR